MVTDFVRGVYQSGQTQYCQTRWQREKKHYYQLKNIQRMTEESDTKDQLSLGRRPVRAAEGREGKMSGRKAEAVVEEVVVAGRRGAQEDFGGESATQPKQHGVSDSRMPFVSALNSPWVGST